MSCEAFDGPDFRLGDRGRSPEADMCRVREVAAMIGRKRTDDGWLCHLHMGMVVGIGGGHGDVCSARHLDTGGASVI